MKLKLIGSNQTEIHFKNGTIVLFSYETPVAAFVPGKGGFADEARFSNTTSKHVNAAFSRWACRRTNVSQAEFLTIIDLEASYAS